MENIHITTILLWLTYVMMTGILLSYGMATFWGIKYLILMKQDCFRWVKINITIATGLMMCIYIYLFTRLIMGNPETISNFSNFIIRPVIMFLGFSLATSCRIRYMLAKKKIKELAI